MDLKASFHIALRLLATGNKQYVEPTFVTSNKVNEGFILIKFLSWQVSEKWKEKLISKLF